MQCAPSGRAAGSSAARDPECQRPGGPPAHLRGRPALAGDPPARARTRRRARRPALGHAAISAALAADVAGGAPALVGSPHTRARFRSRPSRQGGAVARARPRRNAVSAAGLRDSRRPAANGQGDAVGLSGDAHERASGPTSEMPGCGTRPPATAATPSSRWPRPTCRRSTAPASRCWPTAISSSRVATSPTKAPRAWTRRSHSIPSTRPGIGSATCAMGAGTPVRSCSRVAAWRSSAGTPSAGTSRTTPGSRCGHIAIWRRPTTPTATLRACRRSGSRAGTEPRGCTRISSSRRPARCSWPARAPTTPRCSTRAASPGATSAACPAAGTASAAMRCCFQAAPECCSSAATTTPLSSNGGSRARSPPPRRWPPTAEAAGGQPHPSPSVAPTGTPSCCPMGGW